MKKTNTKDTIPYPVRINRYLYLTNVSSRREADRLIEAGKVSLNGRLAELGDKVNRGDRVVVEGAKSKRYHYILFNKPVGIVNHNPEPGQVDAISYIKKRYKTMLKDKQAWRKIAVLGRLDRASRGLMLLSDDGRIVDRLLNPKGNHQKEYRVTVDKKVTGIFLKNMASGVNIEGYKTKKAETKREGEKIFTIILTEGKKHQIRRMCAALGYQVKDLVRTRIGPLSQAKHKEGTAWLAPARDINRLLADLGIPTA